MENIAVVFLLVIVISTHATMLDLWNTILWSTSIQFELAAPAV